MSKKRRDDKIELNSLNLSKPIDENDKRGQSSLPRRIIWTKLKNPSNWWAIAVIAFLALGAMGAGLKFLDDDARRETAKRASKGYLNNEPEPLLNSINPFLSPSPTPTPLPLSKEYVYAGSSLLAVEDANASAIPPSDLAVWRPSSGVWWVLGGTGSAQFSQGWGLSCGTSPPSATCDIPKPSDYDGDGKTDLAIFRPTTNQWWIMKSSDSTYYSVTFGTGGDIPAPEDFDGDGKTDIAVFRPSTGTWYINQSSNAAVWSHAFGANSDTPAPKDFDGDGKADLAYWSAGTNTFSSLKSSDLTTATFTFGATSSQPVPADYDGDGKADYAIRNGANWIIRNSSNSTTSTTAWGLAADTSVQNDYDGDGKVDIAVWRAVESAQGAGDVGKWFIRKSGSNGDPRYETWGVAGDIPVPAFYRR